VRRALTLAAAAAVAGHLAERAALRRWAALPASAEQPPPGRESELTASDGARLRVVEWPGPDGPPVLLVHGLTASLEDWLPVVPRLVAAGRRVVALDLRGHGRSTLGSEGVTTRRLAADLAELLDARDLREAVVAGHSLGGYTALALAVHRPEVRAVRVGRLVLVGATPTMRRANELSVLTSNANPVFHAVERHPRHGAVVLRWSAFGDPPALAAVQDLQQRWSVTPASTRVACAAGLAGRSLVGQLGQVRLPVTVVHGDRDRVVPLVRARLLRERLPDAGLVVLPGAGHALPTERPDEVAAKVLGG
jgi:non-heme chloroperoxidase